MGQLIPDIDFGRIRSVNGSQRTGFEEFCCQIAEWEKERESELAGARYERKAGEGGDGGVESYYELANGDQWGWQAKYFRDKKGFQLRKAQWKLIDRSVSSVLKKQPRLVRYTICLPTDLSNAHKEKELSQRDHWNRHVEKWTKEASDQGRQVHFEFWGAFELRHRLIERAHERAGYLCYWFDEKLLTDDWFQSRLSETIKNAGHRYTPRIHVDLPVAKSFDAFGRTRAFKMTIESLYGDLLRKWKKAKPWPILKQKLPELTESAESIGQHVNELASLLMSATNPVGLIDFELMREFAEKLRDTIEGSLKLAKIEESQKRRGDRHAPSSGDHVPSASDLASALKHGLDELDRFVAEIIEFTWSDGAKISNHDVLLLSGKAGTGKTHLMCDVARERLEQGLPTVLLLGQDFVATRGPWPQIVERLHLADMEPEIFLGALDAAGKLAGSKSLIMIDALNEGERIDLWLNHLRGMRQVLQNFPWVILAVSCRDTYEALIIPREMLDQDELAKLVHKGFEGHEYEAAKVFFAEYKIEDPGGPLLMPEFSNPLFLKLLVEGLHNMGRTKVPKGFQGISGVFAFFIDSVDHKLAKKLGYDEDDHLVRKAVEALAGHLANTETSWLEKIEAKQIVGAIRPEPQGYEYEKTLYRNLTHEGLLMEDLHWISYGDASNPDHIQITRFAYERFANHMVVSHWLKDVSDLEGLSRIYQAIPALRQLVSEEPFARRHAGWLYALSIQVPEKAGCEFVEAFPDIKPWQIARTAFLSSLISRVPASTTAVTKEFLSDLWRDSRFTDSTYDVMLMVTAEPGHALNSTSLHRHLSGFSMADRDEVWSIYLHDNYGDGGPIDRLIEWAWDGDTTQAEDDVVELCATAITWFLSSSNRILRDRATKALVSLLRSRLGVLLNVIERFKDVDDLYIRERLYAVAHGVAMLSDDNEGLSHLASKVYQWVFEHGEPPPHILLRDYARGVIEVAQYRSLIPSQVNMANIVSPHRSTWPLQIAAKEELEKYSEHPKKENDPAWPMVWLYHSIMGDSNWVIYIMRPACEKFSYVPPEVLFVSDLELRRQNGKEMIWDSFDFRVAQRWIMKRVLELGWTSARFGSFDKKIALYHDRRGHSDKPERIGKKYAWIALDEFLAHLADHVEYREDSWGEPEEFSGPWQLYRRDIDPSFLLHEAKGTKEPQSKEPWWQPIHYTFSESAEDGQKAWIKALNDIPDPRHLIEVTDPKGEQWLNLKGHYDWLEEAPLGEEKYECPRRNMWFEVTGYIMKANQADSMIKWLKKRDFSGQRMPKRGDTDQVFLGEFPWAPAFRQWETNDAWTDEYGDLPYPVIITSVNYYWERGYDCSFDDASIIATLPSAWLFRNMRLSWSHSGVSFVDSEGDTVVFDPSLGTEGPRTLLVSKQKVSSFLSDNGLTLIWTVLGEKGFRGGDYSSRSGRTRIQGFFHWHRDEVSGNRLQARYEG